MLFKMRKRKILWPIFSFIILLSVAMTIISFLITKSDFVEVRIERIFKDIIESNFNVTVHIAETEGNILTGYVFSDIVIRAENSTKIATADFISVEFNLFNMFKQKKKIERILIKEPSFDFTDIQPQSLIKKKEPQRDAETEKETQSAIALHNVSIIRGNLAIKQRNRIYKIKNLNMEGRVFLSPLKNRIIVEKCNATIPSITDIKSIKGTIIFKDNIISLIDCSLKTLKSSFKANGNLFDENKGLSVVIENASFTEVMKLTQSTGQQITGSVTGKLDITGKKDNLRTTAHISTSNIMYEGDSLGIIQCSATLQGDQLNIEQANWNAPDGQVSLKGYVDLKDKIIHLETTVTELTLDNIISKLSRKELTGKLTGTIFVEGKNFRDSQKREFVVEAKLTKSYLKNLDFDSLSANVEYAQNTYNFKKIDLYRKGGKIQVNGTWGQDKDVLIKSTNFMLTPLLNLIGVENAKGVLRMEARYKEQNGKKMLTAEIDCYEPSFENIHASHLSATINFNVPNKNSEVLIRNIDLLNTHLDSLKLSVLTDSLIKSFSFIAQGKDLYLNMRANVLKEDEHFQFFIDTVHIKYKKAEIINRKQMKLVMSDTSIKLKDGLLYIANIPIRVNAELDKTWNFALCVRSDSLDLRTIASLLKIEKDMGGMLAFEITGSGTLQKPEMHLNLDIEDFFFGQMRADNIIGHMQYRNDEIHISSFKIIKGGEVSEAQGIIPVTLFMKEKNRSRRIEFTLTANNLGAWIFYPFDKFVHYEGGKVYGSVTGTGTVGKLNLKGDLRIYASNFYIPFLGIRMKETEGYIQLKREKITIRNVKAIIEDGYVDIMGVITLDGIKPDSIDLTLSGEHISLTGFKDLYLTVNPELELTGPFSRLSLLGFVSIEKGDITIPFRRKREQGIRKGTFSYDVEISAEEGNVWLKNEDADVELAGQVFVKGTGNAPQLSGSFETKRGFIYYLDNTFTIERGVFNFTNSPELNPEMDLLAETKVRYTYKPDKDSKAQDTTVTIYLNVGGTMQKPKFSVTSSNPSFNEENIILLLSLGITSLEDITSLENVSSLSDKAASYWIRQTMLREFQTTLGIDAMDLETKLLGSQKTAKLTVGKYISKDLYLGVTHDLFASSKDEFEIEYKVWKG
ncbi:MAG: hypothetical protein E3J78_07235, partial [Candidatus Cloacimonadota bacterium]